jgi:hypothetical protein
MTDIIEETPVETWVGEYLAVRNEMAELERKHAEVIEKLQARKDMLRDHILGVCKKLGLDGLKTAAGTVTRTTKTRFWTQNWPELYRCIREFNAPFLLEQRIHGSNMKQFLEDHPEAQSEGYLGGLQVDSRYDVTVRKPSTK